MTKRGLARCVVVALVSCSSSTPTTTSVSEPASEPPTAVPSASVANPKPAPVSKVLPQPSACRLWDAKPEGGDAPRDGWLIGWSAVREAGTLLAYSGDIDPNELQLALPKGYRFFAVTPQGATWFERADFAKTEVNTMGGPEPLYLLVLHGEKQLQGSPALFLPKACTAGAPKLRPLTPEPIAPLRKALQVARKHLSIDMKESFAVVSRAALGNQATHVVNFYESPKMGYPQSVAFTMKADGTVVDVLLKGETPTHSRAFPYAVDLEGDGVEELIHLHDVWEGEDEIHLVAWRGGKPRSAYVDSADERSLRP